MTTILAILALITTIIAFGIALSALSAIRQQGNILNKLTQAVLKGTKASVMQKCTESYIIIRRQRSKAIKDKSKEIAKDYYRELFDLHWAEFRHYSEGLIPHKAMEAWLAARARNYKNDKIEFGRDTITITVTYAEEWNELLKAGYFEEDDPFVLFMNKVHEGKIDDAEGYRA